MLLILLIKLWANYLLSLAWVSSSAKQRWWHILNKQQGKQQSKVQGKYSGTVETWWEGPQLVKPFVASEKCGNSQFPPKWNLDNVTTPSQGRDEVQPLQELYHLRPSQAWKGIWKLFAERLIPYFRRWACKYSRKD